MKLIVALISSALVAAPALAQTSGGVMSGSGAELSETQTPPESTADASEPAPEGERMVCRRVETTSGSRLATRRVCRTAEQWRAAQRGS
jgi:hypothetical protein